MHEITITPGQDKLGKREEFEELTIKTGELIAIVGNTGSGKSRLIQDLEQLVNGDSITKRKIKYNHEIPSSKDRDEISSNLIGHLCQNMKFVLDISVEEFIKLHIKCRNKKLQVQEVIDMANEITPEPMNGQSSLNLLSGGQTRALMIADIALVCDCPIVLIDEIENAGIDKEKSLNFLLDKNKIVLVVTHDVHTALMAQKRVVMERGAIKAVIETSLEEKEVYISLSQQYKEQKRRQQQLRIGEHIV